MLKSKIGKILIAIACCMGSIGFAQEAPGLDPGEQTFEVVIDDDQNPATGCSYDLVDGSTVTGIELILSIRVVSSGGSQSIVGIDVTRCNNGTLGETIQISDGGWPVASNLGLDGSDGIEGFIPSNAFGNTSAISLYFQSLSGAGPGDVLDNQPAQFILPIPTPTLSQWGLILLCVLLCLAAVVSMRRMRRSRRVGMLGLLLVVSLALLAQLGLQADGNLDDWNGYTPIGLDPTGDTEGDDASDINAVFVGQTEDFVFFRFDIVNVENQAPEVVDQAVVTDEDTPLLITLTGTDPNGDDLSFTADDPSNGTLGAITSTGSTSAELTYTPNADYNGPDQFTFTADDGQGGTASALITITVDPVNDAPVLDLNGDDAGTGFASFFVEDGGPIAIVDVDLSILDVDDTQLSSAQVNMGVPPNGADEILAATPVGSINVSWDDATGILSLTGEDSLANYEATLRSLTYDNLADIPDKSDRNAEITVRDASLDSDVAMAIISLTGVNDPPVLEAPIADQAGTQGTAFNLDMSPNFSDPDGDTLTYSIEGLPVGTGLSLDSNTGILNGTPTNEDALASPFTLTITADDNKSGALGNGATDSFDLTVANINDDPVVATPLSDDSGTQGVAFNKETAASFSDPDNDSLTFAMSGQPVGTGLLFDTNTGIISGTPTNEDALASPITLTITADDGNGGTVSDLFDLTISNSNDPPEVSTPIADDSGTQGTAYNNDVSTAFSDPDGDTLTYAIAGLPAGTGLLFDTNTGIISGTPTNADAQASPITITITADDGNGGTVPDSFDLTIANINDDPVVDTPIADDSGTQGTAYNNNVSTAFSDPDGDTLTYAIAGLPAGTGLLFDTNTGIISGTPTNEDAQASPITVTITADDGNGGTVPDSFDLTIANINDDPVVDTPIADDSGTQGTAYNNNISTAFSDPDGDTLTYAIAGLPAGTGLLFDTNTGIISGTPTNEDAQASPVPVTITADDGNGGTVPDSFDLTIANINDDPVVDTPIADDTATEGVAYNNNTSGAFSDPDGDTLTYALSGQPAGTGLLFDTNTGIISGTPTNADSLASPITLTVTADDGNGGMVADSFDLTVSDVNNAPIVSTPIADDTGTQGTAYNNNTSTAFTDPDGDTMTFAMSGQPVGTGLTFNTNTGVIGGTPTNADALASPLSITITADDGNGASVPDTFTLSITNINDDPIVAVAIADDSVLEGNAYNNDISGNFSDPDGDTLTYAIAGLPGGTGITFNTNTGVIGGTANATDQAASPITITITADDGNGGMVSDMFDLTVTSAAPDVSYDTIGHTELVAGAGGPTIGTAGTHAMVTTADGALAGTSGLTVTVVGLQATDQGGSINIDASGRFAYVPPVGFDGADTFDYTTDNGGTATITFNVNAAKVHYVMNDAGAGGVGSSHDPFDTLAAAVGAAAAGDTIFVHTGDGTTTGHDLAITMLADQRLIGEGTSLQFAIDLNGDGSPATLYSAGTAPLITSTGGGTDNITVSDVDGVEIRGLNITGANHGITVAASAANLLGLTIADNTITGTGGAAVNTSYDSSATSSLTLTNNTLNSAALDGFGYYGGTGGGTLNVDLTGNTINATSSGINVTSAGNDIAILNLTNNSILTGFTGISLDYSGSTGSLTVTDFNGNSVHEDIGGAGVSLNTLTFDQTPGGNLDVVTGTLRIGGIDVATDGVGTSGIGLSGVSGDLSFTDLDIVTDNGNGLSISGSAAFATTTGLRVTTAAGSTIDSTGGAGLSLGTHTAALTFDSILSDGGTNGISLSGLTGSVAIAAGDLTTTTGTAFNVSGGDATISYNGDITNTAGRLLSVATTTGGSVTLSGGTLSDSGSGANTGTGIIINTADGDVTISSTTTIAASDGTGIDIQAGSGTFTFSNLTITDPTSTGFVVNGGTASASYTGSISQANNALVASLTGHGTGTITFGTGTLSSTNGNGILLSNADGTYNFNGTGDLRGVQGVSVEAGSSGTSTFSTNFDITNTTGTAFNLNASAGTVDFNGDIRNINGAAVMIDDLQTGGSMSFDGLVEDQAGGLGVDILNSEGNVLFANYQIADPLTASPGLNLDTNTGTYTFTNLDLSSDTQVGLLASNGGTLVVTAGTIDTANHSAVSMSNTNIGAAGVNFTSVAANPAAANPGLSFNNVGGAGTFSINDGNGGTANDLLISGTTGANDGISITGSAAGFNISSADIDNTGDAGINLNGANGTVTFGTVAIDNTSGVGIQLTNTTNTVSINGGTIGATTTAGGDGVNITGTNVGTVTIATAINQRTANNSIDIQGLSGGTLTFSGLIDDEAAGIFLNNNTGASFTFSGGMALDTAANNAFTATGGGTVNVTGSDQNFIGTTTAVSGIGVNIQNTTIGAAGVTFETINANGSSNGILLSSTGSSGTFTVEGDGGASNNASGGFIRNTTGDAVSLTNVDGVDLRYLDIDNSAADGIGGSNIADLVIHRNDITNNGDAVAEAGIRITNLTGTCSITSSTITGSSEHNMEVILDGANVLTSLTTTDTTFATPGAGLGADGFNLETRNTSTADLTFSNCTFTNNRSDQMQINAIDTSAITLDVSGTTFSAAATFAPRAITLSTATNADLTFDINGNTMTGNTDLNSMGVRLVTVSTTNAASVLSGRIRNNTTMDDFGFGVSIDMRGDGQLTLEVDNNTMDNLSSAGIDYISGNAGGDASQAHVTITNNNITVNALGIENIAFLCDRSTTTCLNIRGNNLTNNAGADHIYLDNGSSGLATCNLESAPTDCGGACANADAHLAAVNTLGSTFTDTITLVASGTCSTP